MSPLLLSNPSLVSIHSVSSMYIMGIIFVSIIFCYFAMIGCCVRRDIREEEVENSQVRHLGQKIEIWIKFIILIMD
jgi:hypothetical protein